MSGIYTLTCPDSNKAYIGQTGRPFAVTFREHFRVYTHAYNKSKFAQHLLDHHHSIGPTNTIMDTTHHHKSQNDEHNGKIPHLQRNLKKTTN
jgi:hypothetical protein